MRSLLVESEAQVPPLIEDVKLLDRRMAIDNYAIALLSNLRLIEVQIVCDLRGKTVHD
jgi:hypothetical protein